MTLTAIGSHAVAMQHAKTHSGPTCALVRTATMATAKSVKVSFGTVCVLVEMPSQIISFQPRLVHEKTPTDLSILIFSFKDQ